VLAGIFPLPENAPDKDGGASSPQVVTLPKKTRVSLPLNPSYGLKWLHRPSNSGKMV
jgi:hypothetical protein